MRRSAARDDHHMTSITIYLFLSLVSAVGFHAVLARESIPVVDVIKSAFSRGDTSRILAAAGDSRGLLTGPNRKALHVAKAAYGRD